MRKNKKSLLNDDDDRPNDNEILNVITVNYTGNECF